MEHGNTKLLLRGVKLNIVGEDLEAIGVPKENLNLYATCGEIECRVTLSEGNKEILSISVLDHSQLYRAGPKIVFVRCPQGSTIITATTQEDISDFLAFLKLRLPSNKEKSKHSVFNSRTEESSAKQYFKTYGYLSQQQKMLQDSVRTSTYQSAMLENTSNFKNKVVLDVGAGTGILSFFALQAGARKVYAIEASDMAIYCRKLVKSNNLSEKFEVIVGKVEEVEVPEKVDMIVSEPMGYMLFNERMLETYLHAKKWLKEGGNMFPTKGILYISPFNDETLYLEQFNRANFWTQTSFHGVDITSLKQDALDEYFKQPVKDTFDAKIMTAEPVSHATNFLETEESDLINITVPLEYKMSSSGMVHGLAFWFDCAFCGSESTVWLSTAPFQPLTHWYQIRLLIPEPIFLQKGQEMTGTLHLHANERQSYDMTVDLSVADLGIKSKSTYDLKNLYLRYINAPASTPVQGVDISTDNTASLLVVPPVVSASKTDTPRCHQAHVHQNEHSPDSSNSSTTEPN